MFSRLGLGTVQFGLPYGVSNHAGRPTEAEVAVILARAVEKGIGYLDTAPAYGDAEVLIGRHLPPRNKLRVVTKLSPISASCIEARHGAALLETLARSLDHLRLTRAYGVLVHHASDLAKPGAEHIVDALMEARARDWTELIGVSIYDSDQLALAERRFQPQVVQLALNVLDRRPLQSGLLSHLKAQGVEVHARSIFLQGALLMNPNELPQFFAPLRAHLVRLQQHWDKAGLSALGGCLQFVLQQPEIDSLLVGVNCHAELDEILLSVANDSEPYAEAPVAAIDSLYLDASRWPAFAH